MTTEDKKNIVKMVSGLLESYTKIIREKNLSALDITEMIERDIDECKGEYLTLLTQ